MASISTQTLKTHKSHEKQPEEKNTGIPCAKLQPSVKVEFLRLW